MSSDWDFISKNKPKALQKFNVCIDLEVGYTEGDRWISIDEYQQLPGTQPIPWNSANIGIEIDNQLLFEDHTKSHMTINLCVNDDTRADHEFKLWFSNITDDHKPYLPGSTVEGGFMIRLLDFSIDNLSVMTVIDRIASYVLTDGSVVCSSTFFGSNGHLRLDFSTPIYRWLHSHRAVLIEDCYKHQI